jgi:hypothetical protein
VLDEDFIFFFNAVPNVLKETKKIERMWLTRFPNGSKSDAYAQEDYERFAEEARAALWEVGRVFKDDANKLLRDSFATLIKARARTHPWKMVIDLPPACVLYPLVFGICVVFAGLLNISNKGIATKKRKNCDALKASHAVSEPRVIYFFIFLNRN